MSPPPPYHTGGHHPSTTTPSEPDHSPTQIGMYTSEPFTGNAVSIQDIGERKSIVAGLVGVVAFLLVL